MESEPSLPTSFSAMRRWGIFFSVVVSIAAVAALVLMLNYLGGRHFARFNLSPRTRPPLSAQTVGLLKSLTNEVKITAYYDKSDPLYGLIIDLLKEYQLVSPKISVQTVDYVVDAAAAHKVYSDYKLGTSDEKNQLIFQCENRHLVLPETYLSHSTVSGMPLGDASGATFEKQLLTFNGEMFVNAFILNVTSTNQHIAYFLQGHNEHSPQSTDANRGYAEFAGMLMARCKVQSRLLSLVGTNTIPADCNLLIVAGPTKTIPREEAEKIRKYLAQGGRLFALFTSFGESATGLESVLTDWGIAVLPKEVRDPENMEGEYLFLSLFNTNHPVSSPLIGYRLQMFHPRALGRPLVPGRQAEDASTVSWLAFTGEKSELVSGGSTLPAGMNVAVIVAVEKRNVGGALGGATTRIVVTGDSMFLVNGLIAAESNREFPDLAVNWLLDEIRLMKGIGPHPVKEYKLTLTRSQMKTIELIFLAGMPGAVLLLGGLVWLRRRR